MEDIKPEVPCQVFADFHRKNVNKKPLYTAKHFQYKSYKNVQVYTVMKKVDTEESVEQKKSHGAPRKLSIAQRNEGEKNVLKAHILITAIEGPWATFHRCKFSHHEVDFFGCMCSKWMYSSLFSVFMKL